MPPSRQDVQEFTDGQLVQLVIARENRSGRDRLDAVISVSKDTGRPVAEVLDAVLRHMQRTRGGAR